MEARRTRTTPGPCPPAGQHVRQRAGLPVRHRRHIRQLHVPDGRAQGPVHQPDHELRLAITRSVRRGRHGAQPRRHEGHRHRRPEHRQTYGTREPAHPDETAQTRPRRPAEINPVQDRHATAADRGPSRKTPRRGVGRRAEIPRSRRDPRPASHPGNMRPRSWQRPDRGPQTGHPRPRRHRARARPRRNAGSGRILRSDRHGRFTEHGRQRPQRVPPVRGIERRA